MSPDLLNVNVAHLSAPGLEVTHPDAVHPVGASQLKEYLNIMYGKEMPEGEEEQQLANSLHQALTNFSTADNLRTILDVDPFVYLSHWITLVQPIIDAESKVGKYLQSKLEAMLALRDKQTEPPDITNDFTYMLGMYDVTSFAIASVLETPHPRLENEELVERSRTLIPEGHQFQTERVGTGFQRLASLPILSPERRQELAGIMGDGGVLIANSEQYVRALKMVIGEG